MSASYALALMIVASVAAAVVAVEEQNEKHKKVNS